MDGSVYRPARDCEIFARMARPIPSRRDLLVVGAAATVLGGCAFLRNGAKHPKFVPSTAEVTGNTLTIPLAELKETDSDVLQIKLGEGKEDILVRHVNGEYLVVGAVCPHHGCIVDFDEAKSEWQCPCHDSRFDKTGALLGGPSAKPLASPKSRIENDALVIELG